LHPVTPSLVAIRLALQATINRLAAACGKGVGYTFSPAEAVSLQDWKSARAIWFIEAEKPKKIIVRV
jgi:hypothetical protein